VSEQLSLVLVLDDLTRVHLLAAIRTHERTCGRRVPEGLRDLARALTTGTSGNERTAADSHAEDAPTVGFMKLDETASLLRVNERTARRMIERGQLSATKVGRQWRIPRSEIQRLTKRAAA
jgi:excisionase family DNA binding protein